MLVILGLASVVAASPYSPMPGLPSSNMASPYSPMTGLPSSNMWSFFNNWQNYGIPAGNYFSGNGLVNNFNFIPDDLNNLITCLSSASLESFNKILERTEPDVMAVVESVETISKLTEPAPVIREVADLMRKFQPLEERIDLQDFEKCFSGFSLDTYKDQALSSFLAQQKSIISRLNNFCTEDNEFNKDSIAAIGDMMEQIADLVGSFDANAAEKFRYWIESEAGVMTTLQKIDLENADCIDFGDISSFAKLLDVAASALENGSKDFNYGSSTTSKISKSKSSQASQISNKGKTLQWKPIGRPFEVCIAPGETLTFVWSSGHNVNEVSEKGYADCSGITNTMPTRGPYNFQTETEGVRYFVCGVWTHCSSGNHKAKVTVSRNCQS